MKSRKDATNELRAFSARFIQRRYLGRWPRLLHFAPLALRPMSKAGPLKHILRAPTPLYRFASQARTVLTPKRFAQLIVILICAFTLKQFYSTANVNELRWILAPTTALVELASGSRFAFEAYAGYINSDHSFIIAASCAGVNFLLAAFLMLSLDRLWRERDANISWGFIPAAGLLAYATTIIANTVRIVVALRLHENKPEMGWLDANQLHRVEGILIYFGFLLLLHAVAARMSRRTAPSVGLRNLLGESFFPLLIYYSVALGIPLANAASRHSLVATDFGQHLLFVLLTPLVVILPVVIFRWHSVRPAILQREQHAATISSRQIANTLH